MKAFDLARASRSPWGADAWALMNVLGKPVDQLARLLRTLIFRFTALPDAGRAVHDAEMFETGIRLWT